MFTREADNIDCAFRMIAIIVTLVVGFIAFQIAGIKSKEKNDNPSKEGCEMTNELLIANIATMPIIRIWIPRPGKGNELMCEWRGHHPPEKGDKILDMSQRKKFEIVNIERVFTPIPIDAETNTVVIDVIVALKEESIE